jgi:DNA-directed RNA polymerase specialized sigma24 family protein
MVNPFTEAIEGDVDDVDLVEQAKNGGRAALEKLILRHQAWIYNIAVRMVFQPHDAEEVTQEVIVKVITSGRSRANASFALGSTGLPPTTF